MTPPIRLTVDGDVEIVFPGDVALPRKIQPRFVFPALRRRQQRVLNSLHARVASMSDSAVDEETDAMFDDIEEALQDLMIDWVNQVDEEDRPIEYCSKDLDRVLDDGGLLILFELLHSARFITASQKKEYALPSESSSGHSTASLAASLPTAPTTTPTGSNVPNATDGTPGGSAGSTDSDGSLSRLGNEALTTPVPQKPDAVTSACGCSSVNHVEETGDSPLQVIPLN